MMRLPSILPTSLFLAALLAGWLSAGPIAGDFVDDAAVKSAFESGLSQQFESGGLATGALISQQLREVGASSEVQCPENPDQAATPAKPDPIARAQAATLVFGHLYLCGKCSKHHGNLAGGVVVSPDGLVLTNYHVLDFREAITFGAMTADGVVYPVEKVLAASRANDIALVKLRDAADLPYVPLADDLASGESLFVISHPDAHFYTLTKGFVARKYLEAKSKAPRLQITADFAKGSSGSGVFNAAGELVGIAASTNSIYYDESEGKKDNLQMVVKSAVPLESIRALFSGSRP